MDLADTGLPRPPVSRVRVGAVAFLVLVLAGPAAGIAGQVCGGPLPGWLGGLVGSVLTAAVAILVAARLRRRSGTLETQVRRLEHQVEQLGSQVDELHAQLEQREGRDHLTGVANRTALFDGLAGGTGDRALVLLDLDGFKDVNDTLGHRSGDALLVEVAQRLRGAVGEHDLLARLGGDGFAVLLPDTGPDRAAAVGRRVLDALRAPFRNGERELYLTASIGLLPAIDSRTPSATLRDADLALYAAKSGGKNQLVPFEPGMRRARLDQTRLTTGLRRAVARNEFTLNYQPVVDLSTGATYGVEALLRWTPPGGPPVPPDRFIPAAEAAGLIVPIGAWVLDQACAQANRWYGEHGVVMSVNVSGHQLRDPDFVGLVADTLERHGLPAKALVLEITETVLVTATAAETDVVTGQLTRLRECGVRIAIDDFGTGYSSLSYLRSLPVDVLKIDRSFTSSAGAEQPRLHEWAFTKAILEMSASLGLQTVAEGVETPEQARLLRRMNCTFAQGYHFSRPVEAADIDALLTATAQRPATVRPSRVAVAAV